MTTENQVIIGSIGQQTASALEAKDINKAISSLALQGGKFRENSQKVLMQALNHACTHQTGQVITNFYAKVSTVVPDSSVTKLRKYIEACCTGLLFDKVANAFRAKKGERIEVNTEAMLAMGDSWMSAKLPTKTTQKAELTPMAEAIKALDSLGKKAGCDVTAAVLLEYLQSDAFKDAYLQAAYRKQKEAEVASGEVIEAEAA